MSASLHYRKRTKPPHKHHSAIDICLCFDEHVWVADHLYTVSVLSTEVVLLLSDVIGNLTKLEDLDLSHNQLAHFPDNSIGPNVSATYIETHNFDLKAPQNSSCSMLTANQLFESHQRSMKMATFLYCSKITEFSVPILHIALIQIQFCITSGN